MLTVDQLQRIDRAAAGITSWPAYRDFLDLLTALAPDSPPPVIDPKEAAAHYLVAACGPRHSGPAPPAMIKAVERELDGLNPTQADDYALAVDRVTVFGLLDRSRSTAGWAGRWPACRTRIEEMVAALIEKPIRRIFEKLRGTIFADKRAVWESDRRAGREPAEERADRESDPQEPPEPREKPPSPAELRRRRNEIAYCATGLTDALIDGTCVCAAKAADLLGRKAVDPRPRCARNHTLAAWDRRKPLRLFVQTATVDQGFKNGYSFGKTMLAAVVLDGLLVGGYVLVCEQCGGWIDADDHCSRCKRVSEVKGNERWYWLQDQRVAHEARRCGGCGNLYYHHAGKCPNAACGSESWADFSMGSVRRQDVDIDVATTVGLVSDADPDPADQAADREWLERLRGFVGGWSASRAKAAISAALWPSPENPTPDRKTLRKAFVLLWQQDSRIDRDPQPEEINYWLAALRDTLLKLGEVPRPPDAEEL